MSLAAAICLAAAAANATGAFLVDYTTSVGVEPGLAGLLLSLGSVAGISARSAAGWIADRMASRQLNIVLGQLLLGATAWALISVTGGRSTPLLILAVVLAFGGGWGWMGLLNFVVVRLHPEAPALATGTIQVGAYSGSVIGPLVFGVIADTASYTAAWAALTAMGVTAMALVLLARRVVLGRK